MSRIKNPENMTKKQLVEVLKRLIEEALADETFIGIPNVMLEYNLISQKQYNDLTHQ